MTKELDYKDYTKEILKTEIETLLDQLIEDKINGIEIIDIPSYVFEEMFDIEITNFNGWQCDWWSNFVYKDIDVCIHGCAWYGTINLYL